MKEEIKMKSIIAFRFAATALAVIAAVVPAVSANAEVRSKSNELIVVQPKDLPEQAQIPGNSFFLYSDNSGSTFLYVEQMQGARLTVFDVTDPSKVKFISSTTLTGPGAFDFVRPLDGHGELVRYRDNNGVGVLDLHKVKVPTIRTISALSEAGATESLGETGFLMVNEPYTYIRAVPRDYQVVDISSPSDPVLLATVAQVKHRVVNSDTGTTYLLGSEGLTLIRRTSVENDYKTHLMQMNGN
jgi:hypothetical protein